MYRAQRGLVHYEASGALPENSPKWTINAGSTAATKSSDWACACMLHYNRALSLQEVLQIEGWLDSLYNVVPHLRPPVTAGLTGFYSANDHDPASSRWLDASGLGNHAAATGPISRAVNGTNGRGYIFGSTAAQVAWPQVI